MNTLWSSLSVAFLVIANLFIAAAQSTIDVVPPLVDSLIQVSRSYTAEAEFDRAFATSAQAGESAIDCCGKASVAYAAYCFNEGRIRYFMSRNKEALPWYIQSRDLRGQILGTADVEYGKSCNNLAIAYDELGRFEEAEPLYLEALTIREKTAGKKSSTYANVLNNLGSMYSYMGEYESAERILTEALNIRKNLLGEDSPNYAQSLANLGNHQFRIFNFLEAEQYLLSAKAIYEKQDALDFYGYINVLDILGGVYEELADYSKSEQYFTEAAALIEEVLGRESDRYVMSLNHLSSLALEQEQINESERLIQQSMEILEQLEQTKDASYGLALQDLARIHHLRGDAVTAQSLIAQGIDILSKRWSHNAPYYLFALWEQATIYSSLGDYAAAASIMRQIAQLEEKPLASAVRHLSDQELNYYIQDFRDYLSQSLSLAEHYPEIADLCYDRILLYKGFLLSNAILFRKNARKSPQTREMSKQLRGLHRRLASLYSQRLADQDEIQTLEADAQALEKELVRTSARNAELSSSVYWRDIQAQLAADEAALEFATYQIFSTSGKTIGARNAALLLLPGAASPIFIPLGSQDDLATLLTIDGGSSAALNALYDWEQKGSQLYELIWQAVAKQLDQQKEIKTLYFSNDGLFHRINLGAIPTQNGKVIAQQYHLILLNSTRSLLDTEPIAEMPAATKTALIYGGIDYGTAELVKEELQANIPNETTARNTVAPSRSASALRLRGYDPQNGYWQSLPWTEVEATYADELLRSNGYMTILKTQKEATEALLKTAGTDAPSPNVIHLATHGYFFDGSKNRENRNTSAFSLAKENMIRSGLILADGNFAWVNGYSRQAQQEDGVLTALECSQLELQQTELVILSACETGLGDIQYTEGVYGLQRALKLAGVRYIIMSLWQVPDYQAQAFMSSFYLAWLEEDKTIPEAFRNAQAYMRARYKKPFDWAGFVLLE